MLPAQTGPVFPGQDTLQVFAGSGNNQVLITGLDSFAEYNPEIEIESSNPEILEILNLDYIKGEPFAVATIREKGEAGEAVLSTFVQHDLGTDTLQLVVQVVPYHNPGVWFEIHDAIFWQEVIPLNSSAVFDTIIQTSEGPYDNLNYDEIPITVNQDCNDPAICTGHDFYTSFYKGYFIPPVDGTYYFYMQSQDRHALWMSENENFADAEMIAGRTSSRGNAGTEVGNGMTKSGPQELIAGKVYAFYATQWIIHSTNGGILYEGPGISRGFIPGENMMPFFDVEKPSAPENLKTAWKTTNEAFFQWNSSEDNNSLSGYNIYINGIKVNDELITETSYHLSDLAAETRYFVVATAVDRAGNESFVSNTLEFETYDKDDNPPVPPQQLDVLQATGLAVKIKWSGAEDAETEIVGYNIYVDDVLYNETFVAADSLVIYNLLPNTTYSLTIEALDAGLNVSDKSQEFEASTTDFDPLGESLGEKRARAVVYNQNISWSNGIGLNGPYEDGSMVNNPRIRDLIEDFEAGAIRWGAISANSKSFEGSVGPNKVNTYAKMLDFANELDAYFALTVGVQDGIDYRTNPETFLHLLEYLAGESTTTWGAVRAEEGFTEPLLQQGKGILLEFGNEVWGAAAHDAEIGSNYEEYAQWVREMSEVVKSSPYYDPDKIIMVYSGRYPHPNASYGVNTTVLTGDRGQVGALGVSGYLGGNLNYDPEIPQGESELEYYMNGIEQVKTNLEGLALTMQEMFSLTGTLKKFYLYESNMTTSSYNGRFGQGIIMTDYLAASMEYGSIVPSIFHLTGGQWRITQPADDYRELPLFTLGKYFNRYGKGHLLKTALETNNKLAHPNGQVINFDPLGTYAFNRDNEFGVILINRDFLNNYTVQLKLPDDINFENEAKLYTLWEDDFNVFDTQIDSATVDLSNDMLLNVPKHAMVIVAVKGENPNYEKLPLGYYPRVRPDSLIITSGRDFLIDTHRGTDVISTEVLPDSAFSTAAVIDVIENTTESILTPLSNGRLHIKGSGICGDDGYIMLHIYAADNHDLSDTVTVTITNQGLDCTTAVGDLQKADNVLFYPNPANEKLFFDNQLDSQSVLKIYNSKGQLVIEKKLSDGYEVTVKYLKPGLYIVGVLKPDGTFSTDKLQKK